MGGQFLMSEQEKLNEEPILMEQAEYMEYLQNQVKDTPEKDKTPIAQISMYQMNKDIVKSLKKMNNMAINNALEKVAEWFDAHDDFHYVLLNHEKHYYTMFIRDRISLELLIILAMGKCPTETSLGLKR